MGKTDGNYGRAKIRSKETTNRQAIRRKRKEMKNPAAVEKPKVQSPIPMGQKSKFQFSSGSQGKRKRKRKRNKGNLPYLRFRRGLRKNIFGKR